MNLTIFEQSDFLPALRAFFAELQVPIASVTDAPIPAREILENSYKDRESFRLIDDVYFLGMVDDAAFKGGKSLAIDKIKSDYDGILIFGITLNDCPNGLLPTRSQLAEISRAFNREFCYTPVVVVFKYGEYLAFANTERLKYKDNREGEKAGKVTLLRDIDIRQPHSGHERILANLAISHTGKNKVDSFASLYKYWQEVLSVSLLNKKFYQDLSNWYFWAVGRVTFPSEPNLLEAQAKKVSLEDLKQEHKSKNVIRLLTRLLFVWFIKEKGLIPPEIFELDDLQRDILKNISPYTDLGLFKQINQESSYYKAILQNLFFATLNCPIKPMESHDNRVRGFRKMDNYGQHRDANFLMRYEKHFQNPDRFVEMVNGVVPFLNGGLFECLDDKLNKVYIDGFSDNLAKGEQLIVPDYLFFGVEEKVDLSAEYGVTNKATKEAAVKGLINILKAYKFTITENTPIEEDVALDPELLGKVFENLLASYNPETKTTARKQTGSFYTPREIVNYMVDESLIAYLKNELLNQELGYQEEDLDRQLRQLVSFDAINPFEGNAEVQKRIIKALDKCTILDPACGSGAFPMGILQKMVHILFKVDPKNTEWKHRQIARVEAAISQLEELDDAQYREQGIQDLNAKIKDIEEAFANNELDYGRKLYLIENCIYGVDIQSIATQISKLRFFISLVVDQKVDPKSEDNFGIRPLPNLETKFVAANTLIGIEKPKEQLSLFDTPEIKKLEADLKKVRHRLFSSKSPSHKRKLRDQDKALREQIAAVLQRNGWGTDTANKLANWDPYNLNDSAGFFDPEWMFDISDGFDIVIGNPPYVSANNMSLQDRQLLNKSSEYLALTGKWDLYIAFTEKSLKLLSKAGVFTFIIPFGVLNQPFAEAIRKIILENFKILSIVDLHNEKIFENATVPSCIPVIQNKTEHEYNLNILEFRESQFHVKYCINIQKYYNAEQYMFRTEDLNKFSEVLNNIKKDSNKLESYFYTSTGAEIHGKEKRSEDGSTVSGRSKFDVLYRTPSDALKPYIEGSAIVKSKDGRYSYPKIDTWLDYSNPEKMRSSKFRELFDSEKIIIRRSSGLLRILAIHDQEKIYTSEKCILVINKCDLPKDHKQYSPTKNLELKYLLAILNSKLMDFYYASVYGGFIDVYPNNLKELPIKTLGHKSENILLLLVDSLLFLKQKHFSNNFTLFVDGIIDAVVFEIYFSDHMKEKEIDIFQFIQRDIEEVMQGKVFENLEDTAKQEVIEQLYAKWTDPDNEVRNRIKLFAVRSPDILKPILESK